MMENARDEFFGSDIQIVGNDQGNVKKKECNFTPQEDVFLCKVWMVTSGDPIRGSDQSSMTFWERVGEEYTSLIGSNYAPRVGKSLPQRWSRIRTSVTKFCAILKNINKQNPSGSNEQDKINIAVLTYNNEAKEKFKFLHYWTELRHSPKWNFEGVTGFRTKNVVMYPQQLLPTEHVSLDDDEDSTAVIPTPLERPEGQKLAKIRARKRKAKDVDASSIEVPGLINKSQELMRDMHSDKLGLMNKQQEVVEEMLEIEHEKRDDKIMLIDPSTLSDLGREYLCIMQQKIFNRLCGSSPSST